VDYNKMASKKFLAIAVGPANGVAANNMYSLFENLSEGQIKALCGYVRVGFSRKKKKFVDPRTGPSRAVEVYELLKYFKQHGVVQFSISQEIFLSRENLMVKVSEGKRLTPEEFLRCTTANQIKAYTDSSVRPYWQND
jgi:hypothetical protein